MQEISFRAREYQMDQTFRTVNYRYAGSPESGWIIEREGEPYLQLGRGYVSVRTRACGICATDLARHRLPFPLPQITGHEVTGVYREQRVAIEINASHLARGIETADCLYCRNHLDSHCPERMTLGIDRLPGGFAPWVLAPINAIHALPDAASDSVGVLIEPFAAALRAVTLSPPDKGDRVAVLGPRRLGMLLIAALQATRQQHGLEFEIVALMRHPRLQPVAKSLGADSVIILESDRLDELGQSFDIVYDTTGNVDGFALAARLARKTLHLKSTNGQAVMGLEHLTSMVINEQAMQGLNRSNLQAALNRAIRWPARIPVYISPGTASRSFGDVFGEQYNIVSDIPSIDSKNESRLFELALVSSVEEINRLTRPHTQQVQAPLRAGGTLLLDPQAFQGHPSEILQTISQGGLELVTSRCGPFADAIHMLQQQPSLPEKLERYLISDIKPVSELAEAFQLAAQSDKSIKLVVDTRDD